MFAQFLNFIGLLLYSRSRVVKFDICQAWEGPPKFIVFGGGGGTCQYRGIYFLIQPPPLNNCTGGGSDEKS